MKASDGDAGVRMGGEPSAAAQVEVPFTVGDQASFRRQAFPPLGGFYYLTALSMALSSS